MAIEVVYPQPERQEVVTLSVPSGTTVADALALAGLSADAAARVGIHGRIVSRDTPLADGDRVEIYRPLVADPKQARRRRAVRPR